MTSRIHCKGCGAESFVGRNIALYCAKCHTEAMADATMLRECMATAADEIDKLREALEAVEWQMLEVDAWGYSTWGCPWCGNTETENHAPDCQRQAALRGEEKSNAQAEPSD